MLLLLLAAHAALAQSEPRTPAPVTDRIVADARDALDRRLLDFPSARFRDVRGNALLICGFVNAKNRMGAYSGWDRFAYVDLGDDPYLLIDDPDETDDILLDALCGEDGNKLTGDDLSRRFGSG